MDIQKSNYGYPKFSMMFGYPKMDFWIPKKHQFLDIQKWIMDIHFIMDILNSAWFLDIQKCILGYPMDIQKWNYGDIQNSAWFLDIQKCTLGYP